MGDLTTKQKHALDQIAETPGKSGRFWRDLGISPVTISCLESKGLVGAGYSIFTGETSIVRRRWSVTQSGRAALEPKP